MSRIDPKNREEAFAHQFEDDARLLMLASNQSKETFEDTIKMIEMHIKSYRSKKLINACTKAELKHEGKMELLKKSKSNFI